MTEHDRVIRFVAAMSILTGLLLMFGVSLGVALLAVGGLALLGTANKRGQTGQASNA